MSALITGEVSKMAKILKTGLDTDADAALRYLALARQHYTQKQIAHHLEVDPRTIRRWELRETEPKAYVAHALKQLVLPFGTPDSHNKNFRFIDLFAGIGGIRAAFQGIGGECVFTSEWDSYAQKTYAENFRDGHLIAGDITKVVASDIPDHDVLLAGFPCQPFSIAGVSKKKCAWPRAWVSGRNAGNLVFRCRPHH